MACLKKQACIMQRAFIMQQPGHFWLAASEDRSGTKPHKQWEVPHPGMRALPFLLAPANQRLALATIPTPSSSESELASVA